MMLQFKLDDDGTMRHIYIGNSGLEAQDVDVGDWDQTPRRYAEFLVDSRVLPFSTDAQNHSPHSSCKDRIVVVLTGLFWTQRPAFEAFQSRHKSSATKTLQALHPNGVD